MDDLTHVIATEAILFIHLFLRKEGTMKISERKKKSNGELKTLHTVCSNKKEHTSVPQKIMPDENGKQHNKKIYSSSI